MKQRGYVILAKIKIIKNNRLARNSFIVFVGSFVGGIGGYIHNMLMSRMLGPADYGIFASLISLFYILAVPSGTLSLVISRSIAELKAHNQLEETRYFIDKIIYWSLVLGSIIFILFIAGSSSVAGFLHISSILPVIILGSIFGISFVGAVNNAGLQGLQRFSQLSFIGILGSVLKIVFGVFFVWIGWGVSGALGALFAGGIITILYAYLSLGLPKKPLKTEIDLKSLISYAKPAFWATFCIAALYNVDVILVKHFFEPIIAGHYGVLSLLGKIIFFITGSVAAVLFPTIVERHSRDEEYSHILKYSIFLVLAGSLAVTAVYFLIPKFVVGLLFGSSYLPIAPYLGCFGIVMTLFSLINLFTVYNLSLKRKKFVPILIFGLIAEISLIYFYHNNIWQVVHSMLAAMSMTLFLLLLFHYFSKSDKMDTRSL